MSLSQTAYEKILEFVVSGKYRPGSILKEEELASLLNISRTPIREALVRLEKEGIIVKNGKSYSVIPLSESDIIQLYEVRIPLEAEASKLASMRATQEEIDNMLRLIDQIRNTKENDPLKLANLNGNLHSLIAEASHNKYIVDILNNIRLKLKIVRVTLFTSYQRRDEELKEHEEIVLAIRDKKVELAYEMMKKHEENVLNYVKLNVLPLLFR
ncbi:GntR family transcriptional regulator [Sulfolobus sp. A20]|uniref:GntR family transcriptional regulator n=1 Tax=Sulfolobaceae TaxID=118883 RepID=UPI000846031E|nr:MULTISPECIES: GntR family transcriptional regulator [unclassified Sulfolobus]TRM80405.1 GntR family transcriptional regulator [Sulfolobus sp. D5]TRM83989.1 GntR family transcriptional regulator [Sulfolobus sp. A20-N-F6]TRM86840.1 GntR family transcriptional regulator [Sulfolobus sp. C3]TRM91796.1 GntR family transcriptional regulator [Sulfolobus sp. A20-N-G8]TRM99344.1 GntR family transcriptional regulator [Sulfolobus sp. E1]TRN04157.1 GntR family transcriptional regulator [Sulfolobus sp. 